jgi:hypothetical protein
MPTPGGRSPGRGADVLAYVTRHRPANAKRYTWASGNVAAGFASASFTLPAIARVLSERVLAVTVVQLSANTTAVRTDGEALWLTVRPAWEMIPAGVRSVTFTASGATYSGTPGPPSKPVTLTGGRARRLVDFINGLELTQPGTSSCPESFDTSVHLRFADSTGAIVARAVEEPSGCAFVPEDR